MEAIDARVLLAAPLTPANVESRLRTLDPGLTLLAWSHSRDQGEYGELVIRATTATSTGDRPSIDVVLVYPTTADRAAAQGDFRDLAIVGEHGAATWDGFTYSEWVGVENVIVEVRMPGGTFGGRAPTASESAYPGLVRDALSRA